MNGMECLMILSSTSVSLSVSLDIVDTFVSNPSDGLDVGRCVVCVQLFIDEGSSVTIISLDLVA